MHLIRVSSCREAVSVIWGFPPKATGVDGRGHIEYGNRAGDIAPITDAKKGNEGSMATTKSQNSSLNDGSLPLRQVSDLTSSHQQVISLLSGFFLSFSLLSTSDSGGKGSRHSTTRDRSKPMMMAASRAVSRQPPAQKMS
jgi:hypothetical protein